MPALTPAEHIATFATTTFKDGVESDGTPTDAEKAATEANSRPAAGDGAAEGGEGAEAGEGQAADGEGAEGEAGEGAEGGEGEAGENSEKNGEAKTPKVDAKAPKTDAKGRIGDLTAKWRSAERAADTEKSRADRLQAELDSVKSGRAPLTGSQGDATGGDAPPDPASFDFGELDPKYIAALARHETRQALKADKADEARTRQATAADDKRQEVADKSDKLTRAGLELHDDFDDVVMQGAKEGKWDLSPTLGELILDSEYGPQIAYELASDPAESRRIARLSTSQQAAHFGRQEAKFEAAKSSQGTPKPKTPQAPPPPKTPKGGSGSNKVGADSSDFAAVETAWRSGALR